MTRLLEIILGLQKGFLSRQGEFSLQFNPRWPFQDLVGAVTWNLLLVGLALALVIYVYRREGRSRWARISLGVVRMLLLAFVIALLNRPVLSLGQSGEEPSVLAILVDDSISMSVRDLGASPDGGGMARLDGVLDLLSGDNQKLIRDLARHHIVKVYRFDRDAKPVAEITKEGLAKPVAAEASPTTAPSPLNEVLAQIKPEGKSTQVLASLRTVLEELQGQRLAGVVLLSDGRATPAEAVAENLSIIKNFGAKIYPVAVGSEKPPRNLLIEAVDMEDAAFAKDIVSAKVHLRSSGFPAGHTASVVLKNKATGRPLLRADGRPAELTVPLAGDGAQEVELTFKPTEVGTLDVLAEAVKQPGEVSDEDNAFPAQIAILDSKISVLYVDGYPRWEYRYLKNALIRDDTVDVSCLLLSADTGFAQEGDAPNKNFPGPITRFPESITELLAYDVVLLGDVDPRQFTDAQLQLISDFVLKKNGGFGMIAGPRWAPAAFRNSPIEAILPVSITRVQSEEALPNIALGFRPVLSKAGAASSIFRFFEDRQQNERYLKDDLQPIFWYCRGVTVKPNVGEVYAEHPSDTGPDGRKSPLLVLGRFGGRTLFSAIDDSWRWRFYTGESVFDTYWVQQIRYLAREKKLGQRRVMLTALRPSHELGQQVDVHLRILDPELLRQLPDQISVLIHQKTNGQDQAVRQEMLQRKESERDLYTASWIADRVGQFALKLPALGGNTEATELPIVVKVPRLELVQPQVDQDLLSKLIHKDPGLADQAGPDFAKLVLNGQSDPETVRTELRKIPSAAKIQLIYVNEQLWNAPLAMALFVLLIVTEWVLRKAYGML